MTARAGQHDGPAAWLMLARFADAIERDSATISIAANHQCAPSVEYHMRFTLSPLRVSEMVQDSSPDALAQTAERLSVKWAEVAVDLGPGQVSTEPRPDLAEPCNLCGSQPGEVCRPTHDGERVASGLWSHPARRAIGEDPVEATTRSALLLESLGVITTNERAIMIDRAVSDAKARAARDEEKQARNAVSIGAVAEAKRRSEINRGRDAADAAGVPGDWPQQRDPMCSCVDPKNRRGWTRDGKICQAHPW